jgi:hypothetical protein
MNRPAELPLTTSAPPRWRADLLQRLRRHLVLKLLGVSVFMWVFFLGYFHTLQHPAYPVQQMPLTALDAWVPFQPQALLAYASLWIYVGVAPGLMLKVRDMLVYGLWAGAMCLGGLSCFYFWPTAVPPLTVDLTGLPGFAILQGVDAAGNACPSLHVAGAVFTAVWTERLLRAIQVPPTLRWLNLAWVLAITWSTVAIRQHVVLDVIAGIALALASAGASIRWSAGVGTGAVR